MCGGIAMHKHLLSYIMGKNSTELILYWLITQHGKATRKLVSLEHWLLQHPPHHSNNDLPQRFGLLGLGMLFLLKAGHFQTETI